MREPLTRTGKVSESSPHDPRADARLHEDQPKIALANAEEFATNWRDGSVHRLAVPGDSGHAPTRTLARDACQGRGTPCDCLGLCHPGPSPVSCSAAIVSSAAAVRRSSEKMTQAAACVRRLMRGILQGQPCGSGSIAAPRLRSAPPGWPVPSVRRPNSVARDGQRAPWRWMRPA